MESQFQQFLNAYLQSQNTQAKCDAKQNENQAAFQAQLLKVVQKVSHPWAKEQDLNEPS